MEFKVLLVLDNMGKHPADLNYNSVKIEFLPPNTSLFQPMDQGTIHAFTALYTHNFLHYFVMEINADGLLQPKGLLEEIYDCHLSDYQFLSSQVDEAADPQLVLEVVIRMCETL